MSLPFSKIVFTGPESTGKSTIASQLSKDKNIPLVGEYARIYLDTLEMQYQKEDLDNIAKMQVYKELTAHLKNKLILCDSDILTIKIWSDIKYKNTSFHVNSMYRQNDWSKKFYILCFPDTEWVADPLRESPFEREVLFNHYKKLLEENNATYQILDGLGDVRYQNCLSILEKAKLL